MLCSCVVQQTNKQNRVYLTFDFVYPQCLPCAGVLMGLELVLKDRFERKKAVWMKKKITPEMVCVLFSFVFVCVVFVLCCCRVL